jgi:hypothetical protein
VLCLLFLFSSSTICVIFFPIMVIVLSALSGGTGLPALHLAGSAGVRLG